MIEIWLQTFVLIALAYAVTTMLSRLGHLQRQFTLGPPCGLKMGRLVGHPADRITPTPSVPAGDPAPVQEVSSPPRSEWPASA